MRPPRSLPLLVLGLAAALPAAAETVPGEVLNTDRDALVRERGINAGVAEALKRAGSISAGRPLRDLAPRHAVIAALQENLALRRAELLPALADEVLHEARAVFDPVLGLTLTGSRTDQRHRVNYGMRYKSGTVEVAPGVDNCPSGSNTTPCYRVYFGDDSAVRFIEYDQPRAAGYYLDTIESSTETPGSEAPTGAGAATLTQILPWGMQIAVTLELKYQDAYWVNNVDSPQETTGAYNRAWAADSNVSVITPLPFAKRFGIGDDNRLTRDLAELETEAQRWQMQAVLNDTLQTVDLAFWSLAGAARRVDSARRSVMLGEALAARVERLYRAQSVTQADRAQVLAQLDRMRAVLTAALGDYVTISNSLQRLLRLPDAALLQPVGYELLLRRDMPLPAVDEVMAHPQILRSAVAVRQARRVEETRQRQTWLDINAYASASGRQSDSAFGFSTPDQAVGRLHQPDYLTLQAAVAMRWPVGNRLAGAALRVAEADREDSVLSHQDVVLQVRQSFLAELTTLEAARERVAITARGQSLAEEVYSRAARLYDHKQIAAAELTAKLLDVQSARLAHDEAQVAVKQAETRALGSAGLLPLVYAAYTSQTVFDAARLHALARTRPLKHFGGGP